MSGFPAGVEAILLDIEGTTTPVRFVTGVLFPFARTHLRPYLAEHGADEAVLVQLREEHAACLERGEKPPPSTDTPAFLEWLMDRDRKSTPLKTLQGLIWKDGYERGALVGELFPDVPPALARWHDRDLSISIYSSGSVLAQQLLFRHSSAGDLTSLLRAYFDTNTGGKADADSYRRISAALGVAPGAILFLSDTMREIDAARQAGLLAMIVNRPADSFDDL